MPEQIPPSPSTRSAAARLTDRQLLDALRVRMRPAEGDPVDVVGVRRDAARVLAFARRVSEVGLEAKLVQEAGGALDAAGRELAELRELSSVHLKDRLPEAAQAALGDRIDAFLATAGTDHDPADAAALGLEFAAEGINDQASALRTRRSTLKDAAAALNAHGLSDRAQALGLARATGLLAEARPDEALRAQAANLDPRTAPDLGR